MNKPYISPDFTNDDIHRIREYNYEVTKHMTFEERKQYYDKHSACGLQRIAELRKQKEQQQK